MHRTTTTPATLPATRAALRVHVAALVAAYLAAGGTVTTAAPAAARGSAAPWRKWVQPAQTGTRRQGTPAPAYTA